MKFYALLNQGLSTFARRWRSFVYECLGRLKAFYSLNHLDCSPQQFWEVFWSECFRTDRMLDVETRPMGRFCVPVAKAAAECRLG